MIISEVSAMTGDRTGESNKKVSVRCLENPELLEEIATAFADKNLKLVADCAEVMTMVAENRPALIAPYADHLIPLLKCKNSRARWEAAHALMLTASLIPKQISFILPDLEHIVETDESIIVRDYSTSMIANFASAGKEYAALAYPLLIKNLKIRGERHAGRVLEGLLNVGKQLPALKNDIITVAGEYINNKKGVIRKAAIKLIRELK